MTPREQVAIMFERYPQEWTFEELLDAHEGFGHIIESDDYFLMGRGVDVEYPEEMIINPFVSFPRRAHNCWFIWAYVGSTDIIYDLQPYVLPMIAWVRRGGKLRVFDTEEFQRRVQRRCASKLTICTATAKRLA